MAEAAEAASKSVARPRGAHLEMVGAVLAGAGLERVAEIASAHAGAPVAVVVPRLGVPLEGWARFERYVHRHTVGYRLDRVKDLTALDPLRSEDRARRGLGLKAHGIISPSLPR